MDRYSDGKAAGNLVNSEVFCRFASILGPQKSLVVLNHFPTPGSERFSTPRSSQSALPMP